MLVFLKHNLVFFAVPKTGTTSYQAALKGKADIIMRGAPAVKHLNMRKYERSFGPFLQKAFNLVPERMGVMREPLDLMRSWYKYRSRLKADDKNSTANMSFEQFIELSLQFKPPSVAAVGTQMNFLAGKSGKNGMHHLFAIEHAELLDEFLANIFEEPMKIPRKNVSPKAPTPISDELALRFREERADEYALYDALIASGGYLSTPQEDTESAA